MALNTEDAELMIAEAKAHNVKLGVRHQNRFNAPIQAVAQGIGHQPVWQAYQRYSPDSVEPFHALL